MPIYKLGEHIAFPPVHHAEDGLLAFGGDLEPEWLLMAYKNGIFPWYSEGEPILWWAPEERMILFPDQLHLSRRFQRTLKNARVKVSADTRFTSVIQSCAAVKRKHEDGTWILPEMISAYTRLYELGFAHSIEVILDDVLIGGLYGVSLGGVFYGESMFSIEKDASKMALAALARQCERWNFVMIDCQMWTSHLEKMGAVLIPRSRFMRYLRLALKKRTLQGPWKLDEDILG
jgi:leucyl/phenylalanyl-tRNA---protein transferase